MRKQYLTAQEVAEAMGVSAGKAYGLIREMNQELKEQGYLTISGKIPMPKIISGSRIMFAIKPAIMQIILTSILPTA